MSISFVFYAAEWIYNVTVILYVRKMSSKSIQMMARRLQPTGHGVRLSLAQARLSIANHIIDNRFGRFDILHRVQRVVFSTPSMIHVNLEDNSP